MEVMEFREFLFWVGAAFTAASIVFIIIFDRKDF